jgi:ELWxxDGT repeat protein
VEPWVSDGTAAGTFLVKDVNPGEASGVPEGSLVATVAGSTVFFIAEDGLDGPDVWITDGTEAGTRKVRDFGDG